MTSTGQTTLGSDPKTGQWWPPMERVYEAVSTPAERDISPVLWRVAERSGL